MILRGYGATHPGMSRVANEDSCLMDHDLGLFAVADGVGGHAAGGMSATRASTCYGTMKLTN